MTVLFPLLWGVREDFESQLDRLASGRFATIRPSVEERDSSSVIGLSHDLQVQHKNTNQTHSDAAALMLIFTLTCDLDLIFYVVCCNGCYPSFLYGLIRQILCF